MRKTSIGGVVPAMITPFTRDRSVDVNGAHKITDYLIGEGVDGIFLLGSSGEYQVLSKGQCQDLVCAVVDHVASRVPVYVGASSPSLEQAIGNVRRVAEWGADVAVLLPPFYYTYNEGELLEYFRTIAGESPIPLMLYNAPGYTRYSLSIDLLGEISRIPGILGIKDTAMNMDRRVRLILDDRLRDFKVFQGSDELLGASLLMGADGGVNTISNVFPGILVQMRQAALAKDIERVKHYQKAINSWVDFVRSTTRGDASINTFLRVVKVACSIRGLCEPYLAQLDPGSTQEEVQSIKDVLESVDCYVSQAI
ncbi:MAG: dihydrodipicolinate synthase family protein [Limnochordia bacterium]|nr:dihydrodipicolinate synthase family protein [Limnochordia bacterium]